MLPHTTSPPPPNIPPRLPPTSNPGQMLHFSWMAQYHIHGAFVQRFLQGLDQPTILAGRDAVASNARQAAEAR